MFARIPANTCGLRWSAIRPIFRHIPLSPGPSSLRHRSPSSARSPQRSQITTIQINELRTDESSGWIAALASKGNHGCCVSSVVIDDYQRTQCNITSTAPWLTGSANCCCANPAAAKPNYGREMAAPKNGTNLCLPSRSAISSRMAPSRSSM